jgi:4-diphosphocytidyl-2-C-methyl-D-erythritol kinase
MRETAYAKVNLSLKVLGREADGYHRIDTLFAFCEDGDALEVEPGEGVTLRVTGPFARDVPAGADNLVLRAAAALDAPRGAVLTLDKRLPVAAGIGGGSADAAAALRLLNRFWGLGLAEEELVERARPLGADVPACVVSRAVRGEGRGDELWPAKSPSGAPILLVNPGLPVSTAEVFRRWRGPGSGTNDLEAAALEIAPAIGDVLASLRTQAGATLARMSGSGATCFALFDDEPSRDSAAAAIGASNPGWWQLATRLR